MLASIEAIETLAGVISLRDSARQCQYKRGDASFCPPPHLDLRYLSWRISRERVSWAAWKLSEDGRQSLTVSQGHDVSGRRVLCNAALKPKPPAR